MTSVFTKYRKSGPILLLTTLILVGSCNTGSKEKDRPAVGSGIPDKGRIELVVNPEKSTVKWRGEMLGIYSHFGKTTIRSGTLTLTDGNITAGSIEVDMRTIAPDDDNYSLERPRENLVEHLESTDFFDVENHPLARFTVTGTGERSISGTMTIRGVSRPETFTGVTITMEGNRCRIRATGSINRKEYGISFDVTIPDMVLSENILLEVELLADIKAT